MASSDDNKMRIDRWLWFTRFYRTRGLARQAVSGGHVKINGGRAKPGSTVRQGDCIEIVRDQLTWRLNAEVLPARRGPASEARHAYTEDAAARLRREHLTAARRADRLQMPRTDGKPDKRTRRQLVARRRSD